VTRVDRPSGGSPGRRRAVVWILAGAVFAAVVATAVVAFRGPPPATTLDERVQAVGETLRCPVCQDLSVADSSAPLARQMRRTIEAELRAGRTPDQIRDRFVAAYGDWILLSPAPRGVNLLIWLAPALLLVVGLAVAAVSVRRWTLGGAAPAGAETGSAPAPDESGSQMSADDRRLLDEALARPGEDSDR
jgi:cytochrome c-type biogenesis protein CcmH